MRHGSCPTAACARGRALPVSVWPAGARCACPTTPRTSACVCGGACPGCHIHCGLVSLARAAPKWAASAVMPNHTAHMPPRAHALSRACRTRTATQCACHAHACTRAHSHIACRTRTAAAARVLGGGHGLVFVVLWPPVGGHAAARWVARRTRAPLVMRAVGGQWGLGVALRVGALCAWRCAYTQRPCGRRHARFRSLRPGLHTIACTHGLGRPPFPCTGDLAYAGYEAMVFTPLITPVRANHYFTVELTGVAVAGKALAVDKVGVRACACARVERRWGFAEGCGPWRWAGCIPYVGVCAGACRRACTSTLASPQLPGPHTPRAGPHPLPFLV